MVGLVEQLQTVHRRLGNFQYCKAVAFRALYFHLSLQVISI